MHLDDNTVEDESNISNLYTKRFLSAYSQVNPLIYNIKVCNHILIDNIFLSITVEEMFSALVNCCYTSNSFPSPDGIPYLILNKCRYTLTLPLFSLCPLSLLVYILMTGNYLLYKLFLRMVIDSISKITEQLVLSQPFQNFLNQLYFLKLIFLFLSILFSNNTDSVHIDQQWPI